MDWGDTDRAWKNGWDDEKQAQMRNVDWSVDRLVLHATASQCHSHCVAYHQYASHFLIYRQRRYSFYLSSQSLKVSRPPPYSSDYFSTQ